jgi:thiamine pyrophosphate-dependent acetolactate synthase large subunit-like protein
VLEALPGIAYGNAQHVGMVILVISSPCRDDSQFQPQDLDLLKLLQPVCKGVFKPATGSDITTCILQAAHLSQVRFAGRLI